MNIGVVSTASIVSYAIVAILAIAIPIALLIVGKKKFGAKVSSFLIGAGVFFVMVIVLESILHNIVFFIFPNIADNIWIYALYGAAVAAIFEETGRFVAMKFFLKKNFDFSNAFMYGVGHGGCEAILLIGLGNITNVINSIMINHGMLEKSLAALSPELQEQAVASLSALWETQTYVIYFAIVERIFAIILQIALSLIIYKAVKDGERKFVLLALGAHFVVDFVAVVAGKMLPIAVVELLIAVLAIATMLVARKINKNQG